MWYFLIAVTLATVSAYSSSAIIHTTDFIDDNSRTNFNSFESLPVSAGYNDIYAFDGILVQQFPFAWIATIGNPPGADGNRTWHPNGGDLGYTSISLVSGENFDNVGFLAASGASRSSRYGVFELFDDGNLVKFGSVLLGYEFSYVGFSGGDFDTILMKTSMSPTSTISDYGYNHFIVDAIEVASVPLPTSGWLVGAAILSLFSVGRRRTAVNRAI